jgi:hypothetical protein
VLNRLVRGVPNDVVDAPARIGALLSVLFIGPCWQEIQCFPVRGRCDHGIRRSIRQEPLNSTFMAARPLVSVTAYRYTSELMCIFYPTPIGCNRGKRS